ncbi:exodeoxyribonuclease V subunit alpha [Mycobacteroides abscessus]|nr:exodeoxyribonuclease V subunit alpha [Mycobacteroides abscessus]
MTVHRAQGSQFDRVTLVLPPATSPLLTRELLYTAVTRAQSFVRVVGSEDAVRTAVTSPVHRASGLRTPLPGGQSSVRSA